VLAATGGNIAVDKSRPRKLSLFALPVTNLLYQDGLITHLDGSAQEKGMVKPVEELTEEDFQAYEDVRQSGEFNMLTEGRYAQDASGLDRDTYFAVMHHYSRLMELFPAVRK